MSILRILITTDIFPPDIGGPATYVPFIAERLARRGNDVEVITYSRQPIDASDMDWPYPVRRIRLGQGRAARWRQAVRTITRAARSCDMIYVNGLLWETALANAVLRKPIVVKVVGDMVWERARDKGWTRDSIDEFQTRRYSWGTQVRRRMRQIALRQARRVIVPSAYLKTLATRYWGLPAGQVEVVYNALAARPRTETSPDVPLKTGRRVICVGRLTAWKGVDRVIEAVEPLGDTGLIVVGDGPERERLTHLANRPGLRDRVYFVGRAPAEEVAGYLRQANVLVLNSSYEGLPHVALEAMAAGLPVVAANAGGTAEVVRHEVNGLLVPPGDTARLREAIRRMLDDGELRARLRRGAQETLERFSPEMMEAGTIAVLNEAVQ